MISQTLTDGEHGTPVWHQKPALPLKETRSEAHDLLKDSLEVPTKAALGKHHLPEEVVLPE